MMNAVLCVQFWLLFIVHRFIRFTSPSCFSHSSVIAEAGKLAVAQAVALRLGWDWVDADVEIELRPANRSPRFLPMTASNRFAIWNTRCWQSLIHRKRAVLALGGGAVLRAENRELLRSACERWKRQSRLVEGLAGNALAADSGRSVDGGAAAEPDGRPAGWMRFGNLLGQREELYRRVCRFDYRHGWESRWPRWRRKLLAWMKREKIEAK